MLILSTRLWEGSSDLSIAKLHPFPFPYCTHWKEVKMCGTHLRSKELCSRIFIGAEDLKLLGILSYAILFFSLLSVLWNSAFKWVYLSFSPLPLASLFFSAICKVSSDSHFAFLHYFFLGMVLTTTSLTMHSWHCRLFLQPLASEDNRSLNAEFQRTARREKKAFLSESCKEIEENNRMG